MKRVFAVCLALGILTAFFCIPASAADPVETVLYQSPKAIATFASNPVDGWTMNFPPLYFPVGWTGTPPTLGLSTSGITGPFTMTRPLSLKAGYSYRLDVSHADLSQKGRLEFCLDGVPFYTYDAIGTTLNYLDVSVYISPVADSDSVLSFVLTNLAYAWIVSGIRNITITEIAPPDPEGEWQDEQRSFWQRILDWLKDILDAILSIPRLIGEFFAAIGRFFAQLARIVVTLLRILGKFILVLGGIFAFLPWLIITPFLVYVVVSILIRYIPGVGG